MQWLIEAIEHVDENVGRDAAMVMEYCAVIPTLCVEWFARHTSGAHTRGRRWYYGLQIYSFCRLAMLGLFILSAYLQETAIVICLAIPISVLAAGTEYRESDYYRERHDRFVFRIPNTRKILVALNNLIGPVNQGETCPICIGELCHPCNNPWKCRHLFHAECSMRWISTSSPAMPLCPVCKAGFQEVLVHSH
jgi:hypothetical protein